MLFLRRNQINHDKLIVFGFVRNIEMTPKHKEFSNIIPMDIKQLIFKHYFTIQCLSQFAVEGIIYLLKKYAFVLFPTIKSYKYHYKWK